MPERTNSVARSEMSCSPMGVRDIRNAVVPGPVAEGGVLVRATGECAAAGRPPVALEGAVDPSIADATGTMTPGTAESFGVRDAPVETRPRIPEEAGIRGSAMPWGLVLPAASEKLIEGDCDPDVRTAALSNW